MSSRGSNAWTPACLRCIGRLLSRHRWRCIRKEYLANLPLAWIALAWLPYGDARHGPVAEEHKGPLLHRTPAGPPEHEHSSGDDHDDGRRDAEPERQREVGERAVR